MPTLALCLGVSGSGKSVVGNRVADLLGVPFLEGDDLHSAASIAKMRGGQALDDTDRGPWLARIRAWIDARAEAHEGGIIACSALTHAARAALRRPELQMVLLDVDPEVLAARVKTRHHAYMPASLLPSQLKTFERPTPDEHVITVRSEDSVEATASDVIRALAAA